MVVVNSDDIGLVKFAQSSAIAPFSIPYSSGFLFVSPPDRVQDRVDPRRKSAISVPGESSL